MGTANRLPPALKNHNDEAQYNLIIALIYRLNDLRFFVLETLLILKIGKLPQNCWIEFGTSAGLTKDPIFM